MNRTFVIPAAIALSLHAMLFVGSGKPPKVENPKPKATALKTPEETKIQEIILQRFDELVQADKQTPKPEEQAGGGDDAEPPRGLIDIPRGITNRDQVFTQEPSIVPIGKGDKLPKGIVGLPKGPGNGPGMGIFDPTALDNQPATRRQTPPVYPHATKAAGVTGTVWVEFVVDERGYVHDVCVTKSTNDAFNDATITAVSTWRFEPGKRNGIPVRFRMTIPIVFSLSD